MRCAIGRLGRQSQRRTPEPHEREYDVSLSYRAPKNRRLRGFGLEARGGIVDLQGSGKPDYQIR
jgi:hypothetical protein